MGKCVSDFSMPEIHLPPNLGKKMETTPAIETQQPEISKQGSSNRGSSLLSVVLGVFSQADVYVGLESPAAGLRFWLQLRTLWLWAASLPIGS